MGVWDEGSGEKSVSFKGDPVIGYRNLLVLQVQPDQTARDFKTGENKYWKHKDGPNKGEKNYDDPILTSPVLVYSPDFNDASIPNDDHVRLLWCEVAKNLTRALFGAKKAAGRKGPLQPGDVIGRLAFVKQDPDTDLKHYEASGYALGNAETIGRADDLFRAHEIHKAQAQAAPTSSAIDDERNTFAGQVHDTAPATTAAPAAGNPLAGIDPAVLALMTPDQLSALIQNKTAESAGSQLVNAGGSGPFG